jgi:hypothetical protein
MKTITLSVFGIIVNLTGDGGGAITSNLKETAIDSSDMYEVNDYNCAIDGIESMILAHACAGIDIESPAYLEGIETAVEGYANNL